MTVLQAFIGIPAIIMMVTTSTLAQDMVPIGGWRDHFPYRSAISAATGGEHVYCATSTACFRYHPNSGEVERITKANGLSDAGINGITWNDALGGLLVHYSNGNLDLVYPDGSYFNMSDIKRANITADKSVNTALMVGTDAYLGCGFGVVVVDLVQREVRETWFIGPNGAQVQVNGIAFHGDSIHLATEEGMYSAYRYAANLAAFTNWHKRTDLPPAMVQGPFDHVVSFGERLLINYRSATNADTLLMITEDAIERFAPHYGSKNRSLRVSADGQRLVIARYGTLNSYDQAMTELMVHHGYPGGYVTDPIMALDGGPGVIWSADKALGLARGTGSFNGSWVYPPGPGNDGVYRMDCEGGALYVSTGAVSSTWNNTYNKDGVHHFVGGHWQTDHWENDQLMLGANDFAGAANDMFAVVVDPGDPNRAFAGSWDDGLLEFRNRQPVMWYNTTNSSLQNEINGHPGKTNVGGLAFDPDGHLWITNAYAGSPISVFTAEGSWKSFSPGEVLGGNFLLSDILVARTGQKWMIRPRGNGLLVFDDNGTIENVSDDRYKVLNNMEGSGGLPTADVRAIAEDKNGHIWVGTAQGPVIFYDPAGILDNSPADAQQILIEQDGNVQVLLETEVVTAIAVDGADRKWIGTESSGAFLLSPDGRTQIAHFTAENSPLPGNTITCMAIDGESGEVFFGTDRGIIGYRGEAVEGAVENECASVFPNPLRESHAGPVAITGLVRDSEVRITDVAGNLVYRTTSLGGQAIWPGTDMSGYRVATGVYLILATDREGSTKCNSKILVVR